MLVLLPSPKINFKKEYGECLVYLSQSNMAKSIIDDLDDADEWIGVTIVKNAGGSRVASPGIQRGNSLELRWARKVQRDKPLEQLVG